MKFVVLNSTNGVKHSFLVIYRKQPRTIPGFITELVHILYNHDIDVVLGDFNINNYMNSDDCNPLKSMMQSLDFEQVVKEPTFISSGTLLDHIYLKSSRFNVLENKVNVYYSDHDAIKISIQKI